MSWRYQPVIVSYGKTIWLSLCEVHIDESDKLVAWTENPAMTPYGDDIRDLTQELSCMLTDALCWRPVPFEALSIGMEFEKLVSMEDRKAIADDIDNYTMQLDTAKPVSH